MVTPQQNSALPSTQQLQQLADHLEASQRLYGTGKNFVRLALEDPNGAARCVQAAKALTASLRLIQTLG